MSSNFPDREYLNYRQLETPSTFPIGQFTWRSGNLNARKTPGPGTDRIIFEVDIKGHWAQSRIRRDGPRKSL